MATSRMLGQDPSRLPREDARPPSPVVASLEPTEVELGADGTARVALTLEIAGGFHINAREPGDEKLIGVDIQLIGAKGLSAEVEYPQGDLYRESIRIHAGSVSIPVVLRQSGAISGSPELVVRWQACTDQVCLSPESARLRFKVVAP
jgi:DsbC/DsbD-like thiol-disulfide interchange protein